MRMSATLEVSLRPQLVVDCIVIAYNDAELQAARQVIKFTIYK